MSTSSMQRILVLGISWLVVVGGARGLVAQTPIDIVPDVVYGHKDGLALTFDVYRPKQDRNGAAILFMVSGGWVSRWAPPEQTRGLFEPYLAKGMTVIAVRHGSSPRYGIPDAVADVRRAVRFVRMHAADYEIDDRRIGVMGMSAGGHLALVLATTGDDGDADASDPVNRVSSRIATAVALVPPTDLRGVVWEVQDETSVYRRFPALDMSVEQAAVYSPALHASEDDAPALVISGLKDDLVPPEHGRWIAAAYDEVDVECELMLLDGDHGLTGKQAEAFAAVVAWFEKHLAKSAE